MKKVFLSHITAFNCIRELKYSPVYNDAYDTFDFSTPRTNFSSTVATSSTEIRNFDLLNCCNNINKLDIMIPSKNAIYNTQNLRFHVCKSKLPKGAFIDFNKNVAIASPELTFIQLAEILTFEQLIIAGLELCGTYVVVKDFGIDFTSEEKGFIDHCQPATTVEKIKHTISLLKRHKTSYLKGINKASRAAKHIANLSASPRESQIYTLLSGPTVRGMYGISDLSFNTEINFSYEASEIAGQKKAIIDICSTKHKLAIEYDSRMFHETVQQGQHDKSRSGALIYDGWKVISIVPSEINNMIAFDNLVKIIRSSMGLPKKIIAKKFYENHQTIYNKIINMDMENFK